MVTSVSRANGSGDARGDLAAEEDEDEDEGEREMIAVYEAEYGHLHHQYRHRREGRNRHGEDDEEYDNDNENEDEEELSQVDSEYQAELDQAAEMFASASMSLEMDNEDLLFNLMYFQEKSSQQTLGGSLDTALQEVLASHSTGNTPYKLRPASDSITDRLGALAVQLSDVNVRDPNLIQVESSCNNTSIYTSETECPVCKDCMESGDHVVMLPLCKHIFHRDCMLRWVTLQDWCPVCRANVDQCMSHNPNGGGTGVGECEQVRESGDSKDTEEAEAEARLEGLKGHVLAERMEKERACAVPGTYPSDGDAGMTSARACGGGSSGGIVRQSSNERDRADRYMVAKLPDESEPAAHMHMCAAAPVDGADGPEVVDNSKE
jgi:hypothetical protein